MKLAIASDIHVDLYQSPWSFLGHCMNPINKECVLVLAGDIFTDTEQPLPQIVEYLRVLLEFFRAIVVVPGNHDVRGYNMLGPNNFEFIFNGLLKQLPDHVRNRIHYLTDFKSAIIDDVEFIGSTFWTQVKEPLEEIWVSTMDDFKHIYGYDNGPFTVEKMNFLNEFARESLGFMLNNPSDGVRAQVVVTHFPLVRFEEVKSRSPFDVYYDNRMTGFFYENPLPKLAICGHTHNRFVRDFGDCQFICNPRGYPSQSYDFELLYVDV